jgi:hypothetical protein
MWLSFRSSPLCAFWRYFFVKAPSRQESREKTATATAKLSTAVSRLDRELASLGDAMRKQEGHSR